MNIIVYRYRRRPRRRLPFSAVATTTTKSPPLRRRVNRWRRLPKKIVWPQQQRFVFTKLKAMPPPPAVRRRVRWLKPKIYWHQQQRQRAMLFSLRLVSRRLTLVNRDFTFTIQTRITRG